MISRVFAGHMSDSSLFVHQECARRESIPESCDEQEVGPLLVRLININFLTESTPIRILNFIFVFGNYCHFCDQSNSYVNGSL